MAENEPKEFYTPKEIAERLGIHRNTVVKMILRRELPAIVIGKLYRITEAQLQEYLEKRTIKADS